MVDRRGDMIAGRYRIGELLGVGAMGSVWLAQQMALRQDVVIKFHEEAFVGRDAEVALKRFLREARMIASVHHRNVTQLYEVGQTDLGEPYLIMERLRGVNLAARARSGERPSAAEALSITAAIADGLDAVHRAGVLHRDVKPENIFLHEDGDTIVPKLLDFGLARSLAEGASLTRSGRAVGTPGFMAPEQARGLDDLDGRVDVYALSVTLYETLTGELPSRGETPADRLISTVTEEPTPLTDHRPDLAGPVADVVMRGLARDRDDRFPDARALRAAHEWARGHAPSTPPPRGAQVLARISTRPPPRAGSEP